MVTGWLAHLGNAPPASLPQTAAATEFSAERARETLRYLLGEQQRPHPIGSAANAAVRDRLIAALAKLGLTAEVQRTIGCSARAPVCGYVENVIAVIAVMEADSAVPNSDVLLIMAHYDSVPPSPGAGDDGAGVAAILESIRAYQARDTSANPTTNSIAFLFTDGEEEGLLGAEAFFAEHPLRARVHAVINLEGAGSGGGPANLLRSANNPGHLLDAFRQGADYPAAGSVVQEVFNRMPNDTDFSVANRAGVPSLDFAFGSEFNHYHSRLDTIENLDLATLQHHGENLLPLLEQLHDADLRLRKPGYAYQTIGSVWLQWNEAAGVPIAVGILALFALAAWRAGVRPGRVLGGMTRALLALLASALVCAGLMWLAGRGLGSIASFPDTLWPWRLLMFGGVAGTLLLVAVVPNRQGQPTEFWPAYLGVWFLLTVFAGVLAWVAPLAANLMIIPASFVAIATLIVSIVWPTPQQGVQSALVVGSCVALGVLFLGLAPAMEASQGLALAPAVYLMLTFAMLPLLATAPSKWSAATVAASGILGLIWAISAPMYSAEQPQFVSIHYQQNTDSNEASWLAYSPNPLPQRLLDVTPYNSTPSLRFPWESTPTKVSRAKAPWIDISRGELLSSIDGQSLTLNYHSDASVEHVTFVLPRSQVGELSVNGKPVSSRANAKSDYLLFRFYAPSTPNQLVSENGSTGLEVVIRKSTNAAEPDPDKQPLTLYLIEGRSGLPPAAAAQLAARGATAMPHHQGDQWLTFRRIVTP